MQKPRREGEQGCEQIWLPFWLCGEGLPDHKSGCRGSDKLLLSHLKGRPHTPARLSCTSKTGQRGFILRTLRSESGRTCLRCHRAEVLTWHPRLPLHKPVGS